MAVDNNREVLKYEVHHNNYIKTSNKWIQLVHEIYMMLGIEKKMGINVETRKEEEYLVFYSSMITSMVRFLEGRPMPVDILRMFFRTTEELHDIDYSAHMVFEWELELLRVDVATRKELALSKAFRSHEEDLASAMRFVAREEFVEEEYVIFHGSMITSMVRFLEGRPMPIDILRLLFRTTEDLHDVDYSTQQPAYMVFEGLSTRELEQLRDDVRFDLYYISRADSTTGIMRQCWEAILAVCEGELAESKIEESGDLNAVKEYAQTTRKLQSSSYSELQHLQWEIESEVPLLNTVMSRKNQHLYQLIQFFKAKIFLKETHGCYRLGNRLMFNDIIPPENQQMTADELVARFAYPDEHKDFKRHSVMFDGEDYRKFRETASIAMAEAGRSGPKGFSINDLSDPRRLEYEWNDKYLPIKPMYFCRVELGHQLDSYDQDGIRAYVEKAYKFNIFYPDIVDKRKLQFYIEYHKDDTRYCRLRFQAGPPYQDIAFRIVNREWELKGFKYSFEQGILSLYFDLKGYWYSH